MPTSRSRVSSLLLFPFFSAGPVSFYSWGFSAEFSGDVRSSCDPRRHGGELYETLRLHVNEVSSNEFPAPKTLFEPGIVSVAIFSGSYSDAIPP